MNTVFVVAAHPDDEVLGCGGTLLRHVSNGDKVYVLFVSDGVSGRYSADSKDTKAKISREIFKRENMAKKVAKIGKFTIVDFLNLKNLELHTYPHNFLTNIIFNYFHTFFSTFVASRPNSEFKIKKLLSFEIPSSTDWGTNSNNKLFNPNYFVDISKYFKKKELLLNQYKFEMRTAPHSRSIKNINALSIVRGGVVGFHKAEAFLINRIID